MTRTPVQYQERPYLLPSNVILFHDWRYIREGVARWKTETGDKLERHTQEMPVEAIRWWGGPDAPRGIRLRAIPACKSDPVFRAGSPWEGLGNVTVIRDSGLYRLWYARCYAESDDGETWSKPDLGIHDFEGSKANNLVFDSPSDDGTGGHHGAGSVFVDPSAPPGERYKAFFKRFIDRKAFEEYRQERPGAFDPKQLREIDRKEVFVCVGGAVSPDGLHWKEFSRPLVVHPSDSHNIAYYDTQLGKYVGYFRTHVFRKRAVGRAETDDFRVFPLPDTVLWPDASVGPSDVWYACGRTSFPGAPECHLMFCR